MPGRQILSESQAKDLGVDPEIIPQLKKKLEAKLKSRGLRTMVQMLAPNSLERTEFKARRIIDKRDLYEEILRNE